MKRFIAVITAIILCVAVLSGCSVSETQEKETVHYCAKCGKPATHEIAGTERMLETVLGIPLEQCKYIARGGNGTHMSWADVYTAYLCDDCYSATPHKNNPLWT